MGTLGTGKDHFPFAWRSGGRRQVHLDTLVSHELHAGASLSLNRALSGFAGLSAAPLGRWLGAQYVVKALKA